MRDAEIINTLQLNQYVLESTFRLLRILTPHAPNAMSRRWAAGEADQIQARLRDNHALLRRMGRVG